MKTVRLILKTMKSGDIHLGLDCLLTVTMPQIIFELFCIMNCMALMLSWGEVVYVNLLRLKPYVFCDLFLLILI